jgi:hypothetical protein
MQEEMKQKSEENEDSDGRYKNFKAKPNILSSDSESSGEDRLREDDASVERSGRASTYKYQIIEDCNFIVSRL